MTAPHLPEHAEFFEHLRAGNLCFPRCRDCNRFHWYPKSACPHCKSAALTWRSVAGRGEVFSFTVVHHAFDEKWKDRLPYIVGLVTFADAPGVRFITNIVGIAPEALRIGAAVQPVFPPTDADEPRVLFQLVGAPDTEAR